jgi:8-oxo-dGTP diphosphatase
MTDDHGCRSARTPIAAAVIVDDGKVLMVRRRVEEGELALQFPAGKVEPDESDDDAAVRETREETGLTVRATSRLGSRVHPTTGRTMVYVACEVVDGTAYVAAKDDVTEVAWCDRSALAAKVPYPFMDRYKTTSTPAFADVASTQTAFPLCSRG